MRFTEIIVESVSLRLKDIAKIATNMQDADFWLVRKGSDKTVGKPVKEFDPSRIGVKVVRTDVLDSKYLYYVMMNLHNQGHFARLANGTTNLVNITVNDIANIPLGQQDVAEATGDPKFDTMMNRMTTEPKYPDKNVLPTSIPELIQWAEKNNKPDHWQFAQWAKRNKFTNVNDALEWFGDNVDPTNQWGPKEDPDSPWDGEWLEDAAKHDPKAAELLRIYNCYENIVFDWSDNYRQMNMPDPFKDKDLDEGEVIPMQPRNPLNKNLIIQLKALSETALEIFWEGSHVPTAAQGQMAQLSQQEQTKIFNQNVAQFKALGYETSIFEDDMDILFLHSIAREAWYDSKKPMSKYRGLPDLEYNSDTNSLKIIDLIGDDDKGIVYDKNVYEQDVAEGAEQQLVTIYTNPAYKGATVDDRIKKSLPVTETPFNKLQMWENGKSMKDPKVAQWVNNNLLPQLKQNGKLGPLVVWNNKGKLFVIDGNHRFIAYQAAGYNGNVPVQIVPDKMINIVDTVPGQQGVAEGENWSKHNNKRVGGMSKKSVKSYRRSHPGSKIQTAVTTKPSKLKKGSKAAKRRKSFCARMKGMKKSRTSAKTARDPNSNINKSLRRWNCESIEEMQELVMLAEQYIRKNKK